MIRATACMSLFSGSVSVTHNTGTRRIELAVLSRGEFFGELAW